MALTWLTHSHSYAVIMSQTLGMDSGSLTEMHVNNGVQGGAPLCPQDNQFLCCTEGCVMRGQGPTLVP